MNEANLPGLPQIFYRRLVTYLHSLKISIFLVLPALLFFYACEASEESVQIPSRTQFPPLLLFLQIPNSSAVSVETGSYYFSSYSSYSNTTIKRTTQDHTISIDLESLRFSQSIYYGFSDSVTLGAELPVLFFWRGAMDSTVTSIHSLIGLPPKNDRKEQDNIYSYVIENSDFSIKNRGENVPGLGDMSLFASKRITSGQSPLEAKIIGAVKLPTGEREDLHGSGKTDFGVAGYLRYKLTKLDFHSFSSITIPGKPKEFIGIKVTPFFTESFTVDYKMSRGLSMVAQIDFNSNPFPDEIQNLGHYTLELVTGIKKKIARKKVLTISLTEDMTNHTTPDFSINIGFSGWF